MGALTAAGSIAEWLGGMGAAEAGAAGAGAGLAGAGAGAAGEGAAALTAADAATAAGAGGLAGAGAGAAGGGAAALTAADAATAAGLGAGTAGAGAGLGAGLGAAASDFALETAAAEGLAGTGAGLAGAGAGAAGGGTGALTAADAFTTGGALGGGLTPTGAAPSILDTSSVLNVANAAGQAGAGGTAGLSPLTSSVLPSIPGGLTTAALLGSGLVSNIAGNIFGAKQQKQNLGDYTNAVTWTPEKANTYLNATAANAAGTYGTAANRAKGTLAEQMASSGRGGGMYGSQVNSITENMLNQIAGAKNAALTTVSTPPNLSAAPFMAQTSPTAQTLQGLGGALGNIGTTTATLSLMKELWPNMFAS